MGRTPSLNPKITVENLLHDKEIIDKEIENILKDQVFEEFMVRLKAYRKERHRLVAYLREYRKLEKTRELYFSKEIA